MMSKNFDGLKKTGKDNHIEQLLSDHLDCYGISALEAVKMFPILSRRQWIKRFLAHVELFKKTLDVPGDVAELGVFRGNGLFTWANLLEAYCIGDRTKTVYGFDNWRGFVGFSQEDGSTVVEANKIEGGFDSSGFQEELLNAIKIFDEDRFIPWKARIKLVNGEIETSANRFIEENPGIRFSLIHFDCDLYAPTLAALKAFWPLVSKGGVIIFDEYGIPDWPGETQAVDEFLRDKPGVRLKTFNWTNTPGAYLIKE